MNKQTVLLKDFFFSLIRPYKWYIAGLFFTAFYWGINNSLSPYMLKKIIDIVVASEGDKAAVISRVTPYVIIYIFLWIFIAFDMRFLDWIRLKFFPLLRMTIINKMFAYLNQHSYRYFQNNFAGSLSNKIIDMNSATVTILTTLDDAFAQTVGLLIAIIFLLLIHPIFALLLFVWAAAFILIALFYFSDIKTQSLIFAMSKTAVVGKLVDSVTNVANVRLFARHAYENELIGQETADTLQKDRALQWTILKMRIFWDISIVILIGSNIALLIGLYSRNLVSVGDFSFIISLSISIFYNLWFLASSFVVFAEEIGKCKQALTIINEPHEMADKPDAKPLVMSQGRIEFNDVSFHYDEGIHLFKNKNVVVEQGQKVGLVGLSGSGKSTFVNLILRVFDVESGSITIDGQNIQNVTQDSLRENIALIPQDVTLFHRSLLENIRYGRINASDDEVIAAAKRAHCHEFIAQIDNGYQALVGERGIKLSGGQRQRIAIARAMLKNAPILILDEATSALDSLTEKDIQDGLHQLMEGRTTIVIAHRLSTLSEMDRVLVFNNGCIIEDGTHKNLLKAKGHYARMWHMQAGGFLPDTL